VSGWPQRFPHLAAQSIEDELADIGVAVHAGSEGSIEDVNVVFDQLHGVHAACKCNCRGGG
jgi:hypothetical protein